MNKSSVILKGLPLLAVLAYLVFSHMPWGDSTPEYSGISMMGQNYTPFNLSKFTITDDYGNKAGGGGDDMPGDGGGVTCCYRLKGTEFTVKWDYYNADQFLDDTRYDGNKVIEYGKIKELHAETHVSMPKSPVPTEIGDRIFEVHFYPDHHVEFQFPGGLLDPPRIPINLVAEWMDDNHQNQMDKRYPERDDQHFRREAGVIAAAWLKYRLIDLEDLEQYTYFNLLINSQFDAHPEVQRILQSTKTTPGAFAKAMQALPQNVMTELTTSHFAAVEVPAIAEGLLPTPHILPTTSIKESNHG